MTAPDPTSRPTDAAAPDPGGEPPPRELLNLPWIDPHNHAHTLSWGDRERFALEGCVAMVMVASGVHWTPYRPVRAGDVRHLWDGALGRLGAIRREHVFDPRLAVGIQTGARVEDPEPLLESMAGYAAADAVAAVGETGVTPVQRGPAWALEDQLDVVRAQCALAARHGLPVILHTPNPTTDADGPYRPGFDVHGYERGPSGGDGPVVDADDAALESVRLDLAAVEEAGLDEERVVASHADPNNLAFLMEETSCRVSFTLGQPWLTGVTAATVAGAIDRYGPERVLVETDAANVLRSDVSAIPRAMLELYRRGIDVEDVRRVVLENPRETFDLPV